jgi:hypothetical protein
MTNLYSNSILSLFVDYNKEGTIPSQYRDIDLRIPLKDLFELGSLEMIDTSKTGKLTLHLELENSSYISVEQVKLMNDPDEGKCNNVAQSADLSQLITTTKYPNLELSPFYVGAVYTLTAVKSGGAVPNPNVATTITSISKNADGSLTLGISPALPDPTGSFSWTTILLTEPTVAHTSSIIVETAELGMSEIVGGSQSSMNELSYMTFTTEEYTNGSQATMNKIFEVEPECVNAFLMFDSNSSNLISNKTTLKSYRMRVDNQDVYNRDILVNKENASESSLHLAVPDNRATEAFSATEEAPAAAAASAARSELPAYATGGAPGGDARGGEGAGADSAPSAKRARVNGDGDAAGAAFDGEGDYLAED